MRLDQWGRDQAWVEVEVSEEEGRGCQRLEGKVEGLESRLKGSESLSWEGGVASVAGLY